MQVINFRFRTTPRIRLDLSYILVFKGKRSKVSSTSLPYELVSKKIRSDAMSWIIWLCCLLMNWMFYMCQFIIWCFFLEIEEWERRSISWYFIYEKNEWMLFFMQIVLFILLSIACHLNKQVRLKLARRVVPPSYVRFIWCRYLEST